MKRIIKGGLALLICRCLFVFCCCLGVSLSFTNGCESKKVKEMTPGVVLSPEKPLAIPRKHKLDTSLSAQVLPSKKMRRVTMAKVKAEDQAIVLLHGIDRVSYDFDVMMLALKHAFPGATILALQSLNKNIQVKITGIKKLLNPSPTAEFSIKEQARVACEELKEVIGPNKHVILVGHSQGGIRGFTMAKEYGYHLKHNHSIVIDRLITIGAPWKGAPLFGRLSKESNVAKKVKKRLKKVEVLFKKIGKEFPHSIHKHVFKEVGSYFYYIYKVKGYIRYATFGNQYKGVFDLIPESDFMQYVATGLKEIDIPITAIAGIATDFSQLFHPFPSSIEKKEVDLLNSTYAKIIGSTPTCEHDMLLPVSTQLAEGLEKKNFTPIKINGACHGNKVGITVKEGCSQLKNKEVIQKVIDIIKETFYNDQEIIEAEKVNSPEF